MKEILKLGIILFLFCAIGSGVLAFVNKMTKDKIAENKKKTEADARKEVLPNVTFDGPFTADAGKPDSLQYFIGKDQKGAIVGYTFIASGRGYSSTVRTMVAADQAFQILKIKVIDQNETPGLGANSSKDNFPPRFEKMGISDLVVDKDGGKIKSITGSTITTRAITKSIRNALTVLKGAVETTPKQVAPTEKLVASGGSL
ncbi:MAG TPA: RnfABCDGE type electron transport complex subunit G [Candidatus Cloacimonadota bacterium]|nr:RnfABCDGE type electron transport complex subunit G [Candidatus Cloacimonadota bacterium]HPT72612.1 RnfABCDGE type electron transport complex subunit G [Candidatus Cloacimonadota bacterium]